MKPIFWSPTRFEVTELCPVKYYFQYIKKMRVTTPRLALGSYLHKRKEKLFKGKPGQLELRFKSAESFANAATGFWKHSVAKTNEIDGQKVLWEFENQKWVFLSEIEELCIKTYNKCSSEESPLFIELPIKFKLNGQHFYVKIDEIRKGCTIRDYKTGFSLPEEFRLKHFSQFTFYALAFCCYAYIDEDFAKICGISEEDKKSFGGNPLYISEKINLEYYNVKEEITLPATHRSNKDYYELVHAIEILENRIHNLESNLYPYYSNHCKYCQYKKPCDEKYKKGEFYGENYDQQLELIEIIPRQKYHDTTLKLFPPKRKKF